MLAEERQKTILKLLNERKSLSLGEICGLLGLTESTARRDVLYLADKGLLTKVRGGAVAKDGRILIGEKSAEENKELFGREKEAIARYAASLIEPGDLVFLDASTRVSKMTDHIREYGAVFVTNDLLSALKLASKRFRVFVASGEVKPSAEAVTGAECVNCVSAYNYSKSFLGASGVDPEGGVSVFDVGEASVKKAVASRSVKTFVLADHSKFGVVCPASFATLSKVCLLTDKLDPAFASNTEIKEVGQ